MLEAAEFRTLYMDASATPAGWDGCRVIVISALVRETAARRVPVGEAEEAITGFVRGQAKDARNERLAMLAQGLFDHMNAERADVIAGIARYAQNQLAMAARLRAEGSEFAKLRADPNAGADEI